MSVPGPGLTSRMLRLWRHSKKLPRPRGGYPRETRAWHTDRGVVPGRDAGRPEEQTHLPAGPGKAHVLAPSTINVPSRPICSVRSARNAGPELPSCCQPATASPCSFILMRSQPRLRPAGTQSSCSIKPDGMAPRRSRSRATSP